MLASHVGFTVASEGYHIRSRKLPNSNRGTRARLRSFTCYEERNDIYPSLSPLSRAWFVLEIPFLLFSPQTVLLEIVPKKGKTSRTFQQKKSHFLSACVCW